MRRVLTFGVFDLFHIGHLRLFRQCREHGDYLIVGVQKDEYVARFKPDGECFYTTEERMEIIRALRVVDEVFSYDTLGPDVMEKTEFDILALGEDHIGARFDAIEKWCREHGKSVVRLQRTAGISSSSIKAMLKQAAATERGAVPEHEAALKPETAPEQETTPESDAEPKQETAPEQEAVSTKESEGK